VITDLRLRQALIDAIWRKAKLANKSRATMTVTVDGQDHKVVVETYDHFGELAYRLKFKKPR
jgi:hypothetical protein